MSFNPIKFSFTPPATLDSRAGAPAVPAPPAPASGPTSAADSSLAAGLLNRVAALKATGLYLQSLVLAKSQGIGITVDPNSDPNLTVALTRLYSASQPPAGRGCGSAGLPETPPFPQERLAADRSLARAWIPAPRPYNQRCRG